MNTRKRIFLIILAVVLVLQTMLSIFSVGVGAVDVSSFDTSPIEDDLANIDLKNYPKNSLGDVDIISLMEYGYSENNDLVKYYGIYVYVYNPTGTALTLSGNNYVNLGFYENGVMEYDDVSLIYLDRTSDNLFYKFKLAENSRILASARSYAADHDGARCYEIIDLQFTANSFYNNVSKKYVWNGYAAYCDSNRSPDSTLTCTDYGARSIHLNLMSTNYRFATQADGVTQDDLSSVFFTVSEEYFKEFGNLNEIKAEWYEYKTQPIYVMSDSKAYSALHSIRNMELDPYGNIVDDQGNILNKDRLSYCRILMRLAAWEGNILFRKSFCPFVGRVPDDVIYSNLTGWFYLDKEYLYAPDFINSVNWLFYVNEGTWINPTDYRVSSYELKEYMRSYTNAFYTENRILGKYAESLFVDSIDVDRIEFLEDSSAKSGKVEMNFVFGLDGNKANSYVDSVDGQSWWNNLWFGTKYDSFSYSPIVTISEGDLYLSHKDFAERYLVNVNDVDEIIKQSRAAYSNGERPMLLRFAVTDYTSEECRFDYTEDQGIMNKANGYVAQETVFLDFDVLSFTFQDEENGYSEYVIGIVAEPIDIINGLTPPDSLVEDQEWWQKLMMFLMLIALIVLFIFLSGPLGLIFKIIWSGIKVAFKLLVWILSRPWAIFRWLLGFFDKHNNLKDKGSK